MSTVSTGNENGAAIARKINDIPNGVLLYRIRDAINSGHAAVMVGAGFSRNASGGQRLPDWKGLMLGLLRDLQPSEAGFKVALERFGGTSGMLRLAEEYSAVFGRAQLDAKIHELMPDAGSTVPGKLHERLLSLPWADVFTTNYDTLLERTLEKDRAELTPKIQRRYQLVNSADGLPFSRSNGSARIVKLHGTLKQSRPLTVTEEDYRNYPSQDAPFVNMVQQSMLENVFCLIGFSGDDPNFLLWSGWSRDRLGVSVPPIYLITIEPMAEGQRLLLEARNIFPIPIGSLSGSKSSFSARTALTKLLEFWHGEPPQRPNEWGAKYLSHVDKEDSVEHLKRWMRQADNNRRAYPGWLVAPEHNRERVASSRSFCSAEIAYQKAVERLPIRFRLAFLYALNWDYEVSLSPLSSSQVQKIEQVLEIVDEKGAYYPEECEVGHEYSSSCEEICRQWESLVVAVTRYARENGDAEKVEYWQSKFFARKGLEIDSDGAHWMRYEEVLFYLETWRRPKALEALRNWPGIADAVDPYWQVRVGALYGELGQMRAGHEFAESGLRKIRATIQTEGETIFLLSREYWAELILRVADRASEAAADNARLTKRIRSLQKPSMGAEVSVYLPVEQEQKEEDRAEEKSQIQRHLNAIESTDHPEHQLNFLMRGIEYPDNSIFHSKFKFEEPNYFNETVGGVGSEVGLRCAIRLVRLTEAVAYVPGFGGVGLSASALIMCFNILSSRISMESSFRIIIRANTANNFVSLKPLTREYVARMPVEVAKDFYEKSISLVKELLEQSTYALSREEGEAVEFALDFSSRLLFRLDKKTVLSAIKNAIVWHEVQALQKTRALQEVYGIFMQRAMHLVDIKDIQDMLPALLELTPEDHLLERYFQWPVIVKILPGGKINTSRTNQEWPGLVEKILREAESFDSDNLDLELFHFGRLDWLYSQGLLSKKHADRFSRLVWKSGSERIPQIRGFYDAVAVLWPAPKNINVNDKFKKWMFGQSMKNIVKRYMNEDGKDMRQVSVGPDDDAFLINVLLTSNKESSLRWSVNDLTILMNIILQWWNQEGRSLCGEISIDDKDDYIRMPLVARLRLISNVAQRVVAPVLVSEPEKNRIEASTLFGEMWEASMKLNSPAPGFLFAGLSWWPDKSAEVLRMVADQIALQRKNSFVATLHCAGNWLRGVSVPNAETKYYVSVLLNAVRFRIDGRIGLVVNNIGELLKLGAKRHFESQAMDFVLVLGKLFSELLLEEGAQAAARMESCVQLRKDVVFTMGQLVRSFPFLATRNEWLEMVEVTAKDPLLEIRALVSG